MFLELKFSYGFYYFILFSFFHGEDSLGFLIFKNFVLFAEFFGLFRRVQCTILYSWQNLTWLNFVHGKSVFRVTTLVLQMSLNRNEIIESHTQNHSTLKCASM